MKRIIYLIPALFVFISCDRRERSIQEQPLKYENIFGAWKVAHAEFIRGANALYNTNIDDNGLQSASAMYTYRFNADSTFGRGKPEFKHGNVEEAHGRFSISPDKKNMRWYMEWSHTERIDTADIEIISMTPIKIVLNEKMGGKHKMLQILERIPNESEDND